MNSSSSMNDQSKDTDVQLVDEYLYRILSAAQLLAQKPTDQDAVMQNDDAHQVTAAALVTTAATNTTTRFLGTVDPIARQLLIASRPDVLASSTNNLPRLALNLPGDVSSIDHNIDVMDLNNSDENENEQDDNPIIPYKLARIDHLRQLLRAMAPIQLDVAAHVATILQDNYLSKQQQIDDNDNVVVDLTTTTIMKQAAVILFSIWLPVAPQITPIVSSLLSLPGLLPCPLGRQPQQQQLPETTQTLILMQACHELVDYYYKIQMDHPFIMSWSWDWNPVFHSLDIMTSASQHSDDDNGMDKNMMISYHVQDAILWHAVRTAASLLDLKPAAKAEYVQRYTSSSQQYQGELVPWVLHPWATNQHEYVAQRLSLSRRAQIWQNHDNRNNDTGNFDHSFACPTAMQIRNVLPLHPYLVDCGRGIVLVKRNVIVRHDDNDEKPVPIMQQQQDYNDHMDMKEEDMNNNNNNNNNNGRCHLIRTATTAHNLSLLAANLCIQPFPPPILLCGPGGSGKSSLVRELARLLSAKNTSTISNSSSGYHHDDDLLEIHVDEEMDTKTLVGSYTTTDIPGEFSWRPGALTIAVRLGKWVLIEDLPLVPMEIQASLVQLLKDRLLPLGNGKVEACHANFRLFATMTTTMTANGGGGGGASHSSSFAGGKRILHPDLWAHVHVKPLPFGELQEISQGLYPNIPDFIVQTVFGIFKVLDESGRQEQRRHGHDDDNNAIMGVAPDETNVMSSSSSYLSLVRRMKISGRSPSVRDLFKVLSRISHGVVFEQQQQQQKFALESQRMICLQNVFDIFAAACADDETRRAFLLTLAAPAFSLTADLALAYYQTRRPTLVQHESFTEIGRARIHVSSSNLDSSLSSNNSNNNNNNFAATGSALRLMESIGLCISENEPVLLVGETGGGKTTILQQLARLCGRELIVQNLSLQTDSTDLLGGYRPLEIRHIARLVYQDFVDLFVATFSRKQNADFLTFTATAQAKGQWKKLSQCFLRAAKLGLDKVKDNNNNKSRIAWERFSKSAAKFEQQRIACDSGLAFVFTEGALVDAIRKGKWVLLDEINLASSETLQRLCGLLDDATSSITLTERGDAVAIERHADFRLFGAMNPATDSGKKDLSSSVRSRFTELYIDELLDPVELRAVAGRYLASVLPAVGDCPPDHSETVITVVDLYLQCRNLANYSLVDGGGHRPRYTLRTLSRALTAARTFVTEQRVGLNRALYEGFELAFQGPLEAKSLQSIKNVIYPALGQGLKSRELDHPGRRPGNQSQADNYVLIKPFWIRRGPLEPIDWSEESSLQSGGRFAKFVLTPSTAINVRRLARAIASGPWPILLEGATSTGKTTLVEYIAARCGHKVIRINNHEHTDVQEYTGGFAADSNGSLSFRDGLLVQALRNGHWVILDELNLAPSEVLEALNRLLDDNRELYLAEVNETVKPHPYFRLFATQNPSGAYGGRKPLSRAFRNRFVELHVSDIPSAEMVTILEQRCGCPPSHAKILVAVMNELRQRRSTSGLFLGKDGYITPRDLLRWAERKAGSKLELAQEGYMLLAERLRTDEEKKFVQLVIEKQFKLKIKPETMYYDSSSQAMQIIQKAVGLDSKNSLLSSIAPTRSLLRLLTLVLRCMAQKEPVLLVGETGCGKTTAVQLLSYVLNTPLHTINCHATTETSDILGGLRPVRGRALIESELLEKTRKFFSLWPDGNAKRSISAPEFLTTEVQDDSMDIEQTGNQLPTDSIITMVLFARKLWALRPGAEESPERKAKRQKTVVNIDSHVTDADFSKETLSSLTAVMGDIEELSRRYNSLFEWADGPLVRAMKEGHMILLDEMSLAEDAVLERLNSVLEPSRTLVLAEKGAVEGESDSAVVVANDSFLLYATMNPGGDFGKRELSPALRSRFTEIWVPPVTDHDDVKLVVEHALFMGVFRDRHTERLKLVELMMAYVEWFNGDVCSDPTGPCSELTLSLRDILTWARFLVVALERNANLGLWDAYFQGACLMHLDGLGLGTSLAKNDATTTRKRAESFLLSQVEPFGSLPKSTDGRFQLVDGRFGTGSFYIETGKQPILPDEAFNLEAPTTATNIFRVLRAMQLSKPVLLEGSPGVGKTSLVAALAAACGHNLVRINLSEQTDMSDLLGGDLPVPEAGNGSSGAAFKWCDGVLLSAIKAGAWVLLDELNLASQSVLEGLNSCLDHRASIFIPELGRSFDCPPSFRVFSAQNPLGQGGGRKGLPKSFLNRFTKVYVEALCDIDLRSIVCTKFSTLPMKFLDSIVSFNSRVHRETCELQSFGHTGSPWEFNLRDVFRWCELLSTTTTPDDAAWSARFARDLYQLRFRTVNDREALASIFEDTFKTGMCLKASMLSTSSPDSIQIGNVHLERARLENDLRQGAAVSGETSLVSLLEPMEAVACCIDRKWPCLLVGDASSGKASVVRTLAQLSNATLVEIALSPSSDVSELVGTFEQTDMSQNVVEKIHCLVQIATRALVRDKYPMAEEIACLCLDLSQSPAPSADLKCFIKKALKLIDILSQTTEVRAKKQNGYDSEIEAIHHFLLEWISQEATSDTQGDRQGLGHFEWKDGVLVCAMRNGHWLHLKNANLCPSSVLDRLNPVLEPSGFLLLAECGADTDAAEESKRGVIRCHPNFRVFLSMNPEHGEVSRAMRNRCVEISFLATAHAESKKSHVDWLDCAWKSGLRSNTLASSLLRMGRDHKFNPRSLKKTATMVSCLIARGTAMSALALGCDGFYDESASSRLDAELVGMTSEKIPSASSVRLDWPYDPALARSNWDARPLQLSWGGPIPASFHQASCGQSVILRDHLLSLFIEKCDVRDLAARIKFLDTFDDAVTLSFRFVARCVERVVRTIPRPPGAARIALRDSCTPGQLIALRRTAQLLREKVWIDTRRRTGLNPLPSVLETSFSLQEGVLDRTSVDCPVTPSIYPFFLAVDRWINSLLDLIVEESIVGQEKVGALEDMLCNRDLLWNVMQDTPTGEGSGLVGFQEIEFVVQWTQFKRALQTFESLFASRQSSQAKRTLDVLIDVLDQAVFGQIGSHNSSSLWRKVPAPYVPRQAPCWEVLFDLRELGQSCSLSKIENCQHGAINLASLVAEKHAVLIADDDLKRQILAALSMLHISSMEQALPGLGALQDIHPIVDNVLRVQFVEARNAFVDRLNLVRIDSKIQTVQNTMHLEALGEVMLKAGAVWKGYNELCYELLLKFASIQVSPCTEFWCEQQESEIISDICEMLISERRDGTAINLDTLALRCRGLIDVGLTSQWTVSDLSPFQTLVWAAEGGLVETDAKRKLLQAIISALSLTSSRRTWNDASNRFKDFSLRLELPVLIDAAAYEVDHQYRRSDTNASSSDVPGATIFSLVGHDVSLRSAATPGSAFSTIENFSVRHEQAKKLLEFLALRVKNSEPSKPWQILHFLAEIVDGLRDSFESETYHSLISALYFAKFQDEAFVNDFLETAATSCNKVFQKLVRSTVRPLLLCLNRLWSISTSKQERYTDHGLAQIYLGLLRFHLLLPDSPLDPGRKPVAKVSLIDRQLTELRSRVAAERLDEGMSTGDFDPDNSHVRTLLGFDNALVLMRTRQQKKIIERIQGSPPFVSLYREFMDVASAGFLGINEVLELVERIQRNDNSGDEQRAEHWQSTLEAFCSRILQKFAAYEEIITPLIHAASSMSTGMRSLISVRGKRRSLDLTRTMQSSLQFPVTYLTSAINSNIEAGVIANSQNSRASQRCARMIAFSGLASLVLAMKLSQESDASILNSWSRASALLLNCIDVSPDHGDVSPSTDEEKLEQQFRAQFPDHRQEFKSLFRNDDEMDQDNDQETPPEEENQGSLTLSEVEVRQLCWLHHRAFGPGGSDVAVSDYDRVLAFKLGYNVAFTIHEAGLCDPLAALPEESAAGHAMSLSIAVPGSLGNYWSTNVGQIQRDFHKDPNPSETRKAAEPLGRLIARIAQLLSAFPGNDILIPICQLAERVRKLDILTLPVGKLMTGLELILKNAQDWEQHASERVRIGKPLEDISALVACFRKLELKSWALLLDAREEDYAKRGRRHWMRLHNALQVVVGDEISKTAGKCNAASDASHFPPRWVWKSISSRITGSGFTQSWPHSPEGISELMKTLDTFILTSPLGELRARLDMLKAFASQFDREAVFNEEAFPAARSLSSLCNYYGQFSEVLLGMLSKLRQPYEVRLKDEVKLAKWDEQSYYALAESTERNHRKLMKIIREYDEVLEMNVGQLLERELERGVDAEKGSDEGRSSIPSKTGFFSLCTTVMPDKELFPRLTVPMVNDRVWTDFSSLEACQDSFVGRLSLYSKKVETFLNSELSRNSSSLVGNMQAEDICGSIFERIESLRADKTTRPMKERALVDLFRELKQHGYQSTKWAVPPELRRMSDLFQIPTPPLSSWEDDMKPLDSSEKYYQRCLSEIGRLRAEVLTLGSKHLTKRQIDMMLCLSEHGLLLILQQRSMISHVLSHRSELATTIEAMSQTGAHLPSGQVMPRNQFLQFEKLYAVSIESIRQLRLLVMSARHLMNGSSKENWARDTVAKISDFLLASRTPTTCLLVTNLHIDEMGKKKQHLLEGATIVKSCMFDSNGQSCLPSSSFWACIKQIEAATRVAGPCCETVNLTIKDEDEVLRDFVCLSSRAVESALLAAQTWMKSSHQDMESQGIWDCHREATCEMATLNMKRLKEQSSAVLESLQMLQETHRVDPQKRALCVALASDVAQLYSRVLVLADRRLNEYIKFYRSTSKLHYVLLRVFRVLVSKGFCSNKAADEGETQADGDTAGMKFEDEKEGTGMGEGEGARDVTDELESEEQLLGLKGDENDNGDSQEQDQKLEKEEAEKGMEMEADFDGEMYDLPEDPADDQGSEQDDEGEELDREMGEEGGENEEVLDEKLWNQEDDEDDQGGDKKEEKLEKNSSVHGDGTTDEMITQEDEKDEKKGHDQQGADPSTDTADEQPPAAETETEEKINEDKEDAYEDSHGVDVRDERTPEEEKEHTGDEISDEMNLDDDEPEDGNEGGDDNEGDTQEDDVDHPPENDNEGDNGDIEASQDESGQESDSEPKPDEIPGNSQDVIIEDPENQDEPMQDDPETAQVNKREQSDPQRGLGVRAQDGQDAVEDDTPMEQEAESGQHDADDDRNKEENNAADDMMDDERAQGGNSNSNNGSKQGQTVGDASGSESQSTPAKEMPNPFRNPGDVTKFWHRKLNIVQSNPEATQDPLDTGTDEPPPGDENQEKGGDFEYVGEQQEGTTQALGEIDDDETTPQMNEKAFERDDTPGEEETPQKQNSCEDTNERPIQQDSKQRSRSKKIGASLDNNLDTDGKEAGVEEELNDDTISSDEVQDDKLDQEHGTSGDEQELPTGNQVVADLSRLNVEDGSIDRGSAHRIIIEDDLQQTAGISSAQQEAARVHWTRIQSETYGLSRRLCEKLRLVMEPLVASKLRGDYRTGKRINMKRVIGYIASGYRKDKIWLRRTKPAKRNYRVLLAVDDSESMLKTGAGEMALKAMATLATGMSQLEIGEVGIASFGSEMNLLHPFGQTFTSESGVNVTQQFSFNQQRTRTALCVESALMALEEAESGGGGDFSSMQLVFLITDGRIERDSRATLRRLLREMMERNILMAMIIVEGGTGDDKKESIVNMKEVTFEKGKPRVKPFMEDYPFPYYIVLDDMRSLPEVLGDALRQWFEMLTRLQTGTSR